MSKSACPELVLSITTNLEDNTFCSRTILLPPAGSQRNYFTRDGSRLGASPKNNNVGSKLNLKIIYVTDHITVNCITIPLLDPKLLEFKDTK